MPFCRIVVPDQGYNGVQFKYTLFVLDEEHEVEANTQFKKIPLYEEFIFTSDDTLKLYL